MAKANGTHAKDIAIYFLDATTDKYTPAIVRKTIMQAKQLLETGYSKQEIIDTIDYIILRTPAVMYSLGYLSSAINDVLRTLKEERAAVEMRRLIEESKANYVEEDTEEVVEDVESQQRNRDKLNKFGNESRKREESYLDMLKE